MAEHILLHTHTGQRRILICGAVAAAYAALFSINFNIYY